MTTFIFQSAEYITIDTLFFIGLMMVVSLTWGTLALPHFRKRLPTIYLIARSWWLMLAALCVCYVIAKITNDSQYTQYTQYIQLQPQSQTQTLSYPYQWLLITFFILIGLRGSYEIKRLWCIDSKSRFIRKLQTHGLQPKAIADEKVYSQPILMLG
ncbi:MAG: hypothetical protein WA114_08590 [Psychrobacter glacincola]